MDSARVSGRRVGCGEGGAKGCGKKAVVVVERELEKRVKGKGRREGVRYQKGINIMMMMIFCFSQQHSFLSSTTPKLKKKKVLLVLVLLLLLAFCFWKEKKKRLVKLGIPKSYIKQINFFFFKLYYYMMWVL